MGSMIWLIILMCCGGVSGLQRWLKLTKEDCQGCNQLYEDSAKFTSQLFVSSSRIIIGGRNTIYSVDMHSDELVTHDDNVDVLDNSIRTCLNEGRSQEDCENYYKVLLMLSDSDIMICGTWGYAPKCDVRSVTNLGFMSRAHIRKGDGFCPADYKVPTVYLKLDGDVGFAGTCINVCQDDSITRFNLLPGSLSETSKTFETRDMLADPSFVYSFEQGDYVYFLFRETAEEETTEKIYSRVGRLCKNDVGSSSPFSKGHFLSYFKARLFCTSNKAGQQPFDHNEVYSAVYIDGVLYAAFSGPKNLQTGSIVCSYSIKEINGVFDGPYLKFNDNTRKWSKSANQNYNCMNKKNEKVAYEVSFMANFLQKRQPLFNTESDERIGSLTADMFVYNKQNIVVLYAGSDKGLVHRIAFVKELDTNIFHTFYKVGENEVNSLSYGDGHVYAMGENWLTSIPIKQECLTDNCESCIASSFPYCGWCYNMDMGRWSCSTKAKCDLGNWRGPHDTCETMPVFADTPQNLTLQEGQTAQFKCSARDSQGAVVWTKDRGQLPKDTGYLNPNNIYIPQITMEDAGFYECSLNNTSGVVTMRAYLHVEVPARFEVNGQPTNKTVTSGHQDLVLRCRAEGVPKPTVTWERLNGDLPDGSQVLENGDLKIIRVMEEDQGGYMCVVENRIGGAKESRIAYVKVSETADVPEAGPSYNPTPISITVLTIGIVISAVVCFIIGLTVHMIYRRRKHKRDYIDNQATLGNYTPFSTFPNQEDAGYLCPNQNWSNSWQSFHHGTALSNMQRFTPSLEEEAPPAYSPAHFNTMIPKDWYNRSDNSSDPRTDARSGDYAEIMTLPPSALHHTSPTSIPPPISPPILPLSQAPPILTNPPVICTNNPQCDNIPVSSEYSHTNRHRPLCSVLQRGNYSNKLNVSSAI